jgi:hypothetical protein
MRSRLSTFETTSSGIAVPAGGAIPWLAGGAPFGPAQRLADSDHPIGDPFA